jgi:predicted ATP-dependent serine protease
MTHEIKEYRELTEVISQRILVQNTLDVKPEYYDETDKLIKRKQTLKKQIVAYYDGIRSARHGGYETLTEYYKRMTDTMDMDDDGLIISKKYKLGIEVIDNEWLNGKGVTSNALVAIGAESGVGKSSFAFMIMQSLAKQNVKTHFCSLEMGDIQLFSEINPAEKNKLKEIINSPYADNITIDFNSRDVDDLATTIQTLHDEGANAFIIDSYISIYSRNGGGEFEKMKVVVDMLATLKKELGVLIILIAQISKGDSKDQIFDFAGGNILKSESDLALFIRKVEGEEDGTKRHVHCEKNRIFEDKVGYGIVTDYDRENHKIVKICNFKDYANNDILKAQSWGKKLKKDS